jgi:hypothetical protein
MEISNGLPRVLGATGTRDVVPFLVEGPIGRWVDWIQGRALRSKLVSFAWNILRIPRQ